MPRKKSASKKAQAQPKISQESDVVENVSTQKNLVHDTEAAPSSEEESSDSEDEDDFGELLTENVEKSIQNVIETIKNDPKKLLDPNTKFFNEEDFQVNKETSEKPLYLKEYHRKHLFSGGYKDEADNEYGTVDGEKPYALVEREERDKLLADINDAFEEDDEDDFMKKKDVPQRKPEEAPLELPNSRIHPEDFLSSFLSNEAWIPKKNDKVINLDQIDPDDEQEFDDAVEDLERAFNFRYEDPNSAEIVSYARTQASLRRGKTNSRKRARDKKIALKEQEKHEVEQALQKKKNAKVNKVVDRLKKIKEAVGDDINDEVIEKVFGDSLMNDDFDDADWDNRMAEIFNEQYYGSEMTKPDWGDDDEIMAEFHAGKNDDEPEDDADEDQEDYSEAEEEATGETGPEIEVGQKAGSKKTSKKDKLKEKHSAKKESKSLREKAQKIVEANTLTIREEIEEERGRSREDDIKFKYREVSPESFGLSTREIFLADDSALNQFISIKKFAPYKPKEAALKDKRKFTKKKHLSRWRHEVFRDKNGPARQENEQEDEIWIPNEDVVEQPRKKKSKVSKKH